MLYQKIPIRVQGQTAQLFTYILYNSPDIDKSRVRPLIIISPGGGYHFTSDREAEPIAIRFNAMGFHAMVLRYTTPSRFPVPVSWFQPYDTPGSMLMNGASIPTRLYCADFQQEGI